MDLTLHFIFVRNFLTCMELFASAFIFYHKHEKKKFFVIRILGVFAFLFGLSLLVGYLVFIIFKAVGYEKNLYIISSIFAYAVLFLIQIPIMCFLFKTKKKENGSIIIFAYVYRQVVFSSYIAIFTLINPHFVFHKYEYLNWSNICIYLGYLLASYLGMFFYNHRKIPKDTNQIERPILWILILAVSASVILYSIGECYSRDESDFMYSLLLFSNIISLLLVSLIEFISRKMYALRNENIVTNQLLQERENQFKFAKANAERLHIIAHDLKHQTAILRRGGEEAEKVLDNIDNSVKDYESVLITENQILNIIFNEKWQYCQKHQIRLSTIVDPKAFDKLETLELYNLFGNLLDNAIEASRKLNLKDKRTISLKVTYEKGVSMIDMRNYFDKYTKIDNNTSKKDSFNHGYGIKSMKNIVDKYNGDFQTKVEDDIFIVKIIIPD